MRTAEEIIETDIPFAHYKFEDGSGEIEVYSKHEVKNYINIARKEAIEECAERAETDGHPDDGFWVDRQSILTLIKELK